MTLTMPTEFLAHTGLTLDQRIAAWNDRSGRLATVQVAADQAAAVRAERIAATTHHDLKW